MLTQGDSLYDIIDKRDHSSVQSQLLQTGFSPCPDTGLDSRTFFCRMNVSRSFRRQSGFGDHKVLFCLCNHFHFSYIYQAGHFRENSCFRNQK